MNAPREKIIRLHILRPYGQGREKIKDKMTSYIDYFLEDLAAAITEQDKEKVLIKWIEKVKKDGSKKEG